MRKRVVAVTIGALALAGACATTSTGARRTSELETSPAPQPARRSYSGAALDSVFAQAIADREGPRVSIRAEVTQAAATRRVRARFTADDDAYVLIGHVDAEGIVRMVFPSEPHDDGFVQGGGRSYQTAEFFGGFRDQYSFRYATYGRYAGPRSYAYDGNGGYLFIIASWRPMHFEKFASDGGWDSFEVTTEAYVRDPRPAIHEFASVLVGENPEAYTVKFASYYNSLNLSPYGGYSSFSSFGLGLCNAGYLGWGGSIPWSYLSITAPFLTSNFGGTQTFFYRGRRYAYDSLQDCAYQLPYYTYPGFANVPRIAAGPVRPGNPATPTGRTRVLGAVDSPRGPLEPKPTGGRFTPTTAASDGQTASRGVAARFSPEYRNRGLITADEPANDAPRRPSIQQMTERRMRNAYEGTGYTGARLNTDEAWRQPADRQPVARQPVERARIRDNGDQGARTNPRTYENPRSEAPRMSAPPPRAEPRSEPARAEPRSTPASTSSKPTTPP